MYTKMTKNVLYYQFFAKIQAWATQQTDIYSIHLNNRTKPPVDERGLNSLYIKPSVREQICFYLSSRELFECDSLLHVNRHSIMLASSVH